MESECSGDLFVPCNGLLFAEAVVGFLLRPGGKEGVCVCVCIVLSYKAVLCCCVKEYFQASLVAQWLRIRLPMQGTRA